MLFSPVLLYRCSENAGGGQRRDGGACEGLQAAAGDHREVPQRRHLAAELLSADAVPAHQAAAPAAAAAAAPAAPAVAAVAWPAAAAGVVDFVMVLVVVGGGGE